MRNWLKMPLRPLLSSFFLRETNCVVFSQTLFLATLTPFLAFATGIEPRKWAHEGTEFPLDPQVHYGKLENGLRYAWVDNKTQPMRCSLRLLVQVGSLHETDAEQGVAHFLEHLLFYNTKHYPNRSLIPWLQKNGMLFGPDVNASTSFDQTEYMLELSDCTPARIEEGLGVFRDYADGALILEADVKGEQGIIDAEEQQGDTVDLRTTKHLCHSVLQGTRYEHRLPIGKKDTRHTFTRETINEFYKKWYRPDNMTVLLVGDFQNQDLTPIFPRQFASISKPTLPFPKDPSLGTVNPQKKEWVFSVNGHEGSIDLSLLSVGPAFTLTTWAQYDQKVKLDSLTRLYQKSREWYFSSHDIESHTGLMGENPLFDFSQTGLWINLKPNRWKEGLTQAFSWHQAFLEEGVSPRYVEELKAQVHVYWEEKLKSEHTYAILYELSQDAKGQLPRIDPKAEMKRVDSLWANTTAADYTEMARKIFSFAEIQKKSIYAQQGDQSPIAQKPFLSTLHNAVKNPPYLQDGIGTHTAPIAFQYQTEKRNTPSAYTEETNPKYRFKTLRFPNGAITHFKEMKDPSLPDGMYWKIKLAEGPWDLQNVDPAYASTAFFGAMAGWTRKHTAVERESFFSGTKSSVQILWNENGIGGQGTTEQKESLRLFEWVRATLTDASINAHWLIEQKKNWIQSLDRRKETLIGVLNQMYEPLLFGNDRRFAFTPKSGIEAWQQEGMETWVQKDILSRCPEITVVGTFEEKSLKEILDQVFGNLVCQKSPSVSTLRTRAPKMQSGIHKRYEISTEDPAAHLLQFIPLRLKTPIYSKGIFMTLDNLLGNRLLKTFRTDAGITYSPSVVADRHKPWYLDEVTVTIHIDPKLLPQAESMMGTFFQNLHFSSEEIKEAVAPVITQLTSAPLSAGWWASILDALSGEAKEELNIEDSIRTLKALQPKDVDQLLQEMFPAPLPHSTLVVVPKKAK